VQKHILAENNYIYGAVFFRTAVPLLTGLQPGQPGRNVHFPLSEITMQRFMV
jgi:hypothetical protein